MFYGEYEHALDRKGRLIIPSKFRDAMKEHYVEKLFITYVCGRRVEGAGAKI